MESLREARHDEDVGEVEVVNHLLQLGGVDLSEPGWLFRPCLSGLIRLVFEACLCLRLIFAWCYGQC